ncbi:hypothetical protein GGI07_003903 [Coemansia sp. Benny D115]|nr:hypothetical protein GGI07_003903 [Coemansia sp. Benny D115]
MALLPADRTHHLRTYRHLLREVNRQFTSVNSNRAWAAQLRLQWQAPDSPSPIAASNMLCYLANTRKYKDLIAEFNPKMPETDRIERTARRVGLEAPKAFSE